MIRKRWAVAATDVARQRALAAALGVHPITAALLLRRGVSTPAEAERYLRASLEELGDPWLLADMATAIERIRQAVARCERILVFGDYDVDGLTGSAVLVSTLRQVGGEVSADVPHRTEDGYGLTDAAVRRVLDSGAQLLITVDCGSTDGGAIAAVQCAGIDVIVLDHHTLTGELPPAVAVINPMRPDCRYPDKHLASAGLAGRLSQALLGSGDRRWERGLDLIALGTVADVMPMVGENRVYVREGLRQLRDTSRRGLQALMAVAGIDGGPLSTFHLGFVLGPRLNASGRMGSAARALELLLTDSEDRAGALAAELHEENRRRQRVEQCVLKEALDVIEHSVNFTRDRVIVVAREGWHQGVVGIVAARLADRFSRPAVVVGLDGEVGRGSGRSIPSFDLIQAVSAAGEGLLAFGGHAQACGLTVRRGDVEAFREAINDYAERHLAPEALVPEVPIELEVALEDVSEPVVREIGRLEPYGPGNPRPVLVARNVSLRGAPRPIGSNHVKAWVTDGHLTCELIGFGKRDLTAFLEHWGRFDLAFTPTLNTYRGETTLQLELKDAQPSGA